ncbi:TMEM175 family protein [Sphingomonas sp. BIUV-7]|uniref:TMEM175 family protein n=1 Tax=Sphingomonas natans TaxID=3063330 RepID=A0ABT8Y8L6_9SPHN|nr:TMEM175 family protein [Sphingomonas sp. BIUV-7]MDO6414665.1 TMEM175 family protein [Sphingomonas sp. BIUV-7]
MHDSRLERLVFFSDAVIAIAITLLVIEIHVPHLTTDAGWRPAAEALRHLVPQFTGYVVSFLAIGSFWALHHRIFGLVERYDNSFVWPNLHLLLLIAFIPFATAFMSNNMGQIATHLFYTATLFVAGLCQVRLGHRVLQRRFVGAQVDPAELVRLRRRLFALPITAVIASVVAWLAPSFSNLAMGLLPLLVWLLMRRPVSESDIARLA